MSVDAVRNGDAHDAAPELPEPEVLPVRTMLEEFDVNVLAPLVRCSKPDISALPPPDIAVRDACDAHADDPGRGVLPRANSTHLGLLDERKRARRVLDGPLGSLDIAPRLTRTDPDRPLTVASLAPSPTAVALRSAQEQPPPRRPAGAGQPVSARCARRAAREPEWRLAGGRYRAAVAWAFKEGIGCALLRKPELVADMVRAVHGRMGWAFPISVKIRIDPELERTHTLVRNAIAAGASYVTIHGRTRHQASTEDVSLAGIRFAVECARGEVPAVGNGDIWSLGDAHTMRAKTGVKGVMAARGLLANPALFAGYERTPSHAVANFVNLATDYGLIYSLYHRHVAYMLEERFSKPEKVWFNSLGSTVQVVEYLQNRGLDFAQQREINDAVMGYRL
ncbi:hypothetical protein A1Q2_00858 [Trichosporon asahii var. asahii CBS 8904]|uniref:DUS-like FMN-binding domain-containing protein n=2 Tax=Trichosporon asahii var. asahii TaxID=189963 RepID=K1VZ41_TRIAC|nr:hypothetical protein A1Q1_05803 [Trichosporon asahii var. asahii CBS 2479]EJT45654.1 hypothetical protein A1Q1_05803 [Trichosporon asahii var. asahii CBS 2479]EKD04837.1 hypothetical protein A1Q2_00858 [Trichosporon asahii var. asahii CBS 8904]